MPSILLRDAVRGVLIDFFVSLVATAGLFFILGYFIFFGG
jgi:hypothetical protein